jgi:kexin
MKWCRGLASALLLSSSTYAQDHTPRKRDYNAKDHYAVHLQPDQDPQRVAHQLGLEYDGPLGALDHHYIFTDAQPKPQYDYIKSLKSDLKRRRRKREAGAEEPHVLDHILLSQKQDLSKRFPLVKRSLPPLEERSRGSFPHLNGFRADLSPDWAVEKGLEIAQNLSIADPIFQEQWHLYNHRELGHDINVTGVWAQGITGKGSVVAIVDDGLDFHSGDLEKTYFAEGSWDYNGGSPNPLPQLSDDRHGTRCAGEISAARNDVCGVGVAYDGRVAGIRILSSAISDADEAESMNYAYQQNHIYSCSWGPPDNGQAMEAPGILIRRALVNGIQKGRGGLGSIYVFAAGNGAANDDNCNFDGYTNSIYSVSVGGIDRKGLHPYYSEKCSAQLVVTYSSGSGDAIHTTDVGANQCYTNHGGTSAAGPLVAGIYALMLEVNPHLNWRDIQWLTALTAVKLDQDSDYQYNKAIGKDFSHQFGYGKADAWALVEAAKNWTSVKPQAWWFGPWVHVKHPIPQGDQGLVSEYEVTADMLKEANLARIEHVTVTMNVPHQRRGDLSVELHSPSGMISHIATTRRNDDRRAGYKDWSFMSVAHWGEDGIGTWKVIVKDTVVNQHTGIFEDWHLKFYGESINGDNQALLPLPTEHDDDNHDVYEPTHTVTAIPHTTSIVVPTETGPPAGNPTDHIDRPTKARPTASITPAPSPPPSPSTTSIAEGDKSNLLPHPFPTFGVSKRTQIWIYGAVVLILAFLSALTLWAILAKRKQRRSKLAYEFEMVDQQDDEEAPLAGSAAAGKRKRRAGELYDAFAEGGSSSDGIDTDEAEMFDVGSDDGDGVEDAENKIAEPYRDDDLKTKKEGGSGTS